MCEEKMSSFKQWSHLLLTECLCYSNSYKLFQKLRLYDKENFEAGLYNVVNFHFSLAEYFKQSMQITGRKSFIANAKFALK